MVEVKICGVTCEGDLEGAIQAGADSVGFIVDVPTSPRNLPLKEAETLLDKLPSRILGVAVTTFSNLKRVMEIIQALEPNLIQLYGRVNIGDLKILASTVKVVMAVDPRLRGAAQLALKYSNLTHAVLVDTHSETGLGGTGYAHDWAVSREIRDRICPARMYLAGGLTPWNVRSAIRFVRPHGVDVSTGVEARPGVKDRMKMIEFVRRAKEAEAP
ncbi:MAG: phosphoribosylanthranilate isomerase [Candidatus Bathyarchaeia archaeon]